MKEYTGLVVGGPAAGRIVTMPHNVYAVVQREEPRFDSVNSSPPTKSSNFYYHFVQGIVHKSGRQMQNFWVPETVMHDTDVEDKLVWALARIFDTYIQAELAEGSRRDFYANLK